MKRCEEPTWERTPDARGARPADRVCAQPSAFWCEPRHSTPAGGHPAWTQRHGQDHDGATEGLAPLVRTEIYRSIGRLKAEGLSMLLIDKDVRALARVAQVHYVLEKGRVVWSGSSADLATSRDVQQRYLGV